MKQLLFTIAVAFTLNTAAQTRVFTPKTGDTELDQTLVNVNNEAVKDLNTFKNHLQTALAFPVKKTEELLQTLAPGDVFMVAQTAQITSKPVDDVVKSYNMNKDKGWGAIAKDLGIKPGSKEFHALKGKVKENKGKGPKGNKGDKGEKSEEKDHGKRKGNSKTKH